MNGAVLSPLWGLPFAGLLLSIALMPSALPKFWHRHDGKVVLLWALAFALPFTVSYGAGAMAHEMAHVLLAEYLPFVILLAALFVVAGGIHVRGNLRGSPTHNTALLALGAVLAGWMGTTGASMLLIRPLIRANDNRTHRVHVVVFFIFVVSNVGGALTPLGDPPLFLGFLKGVDFFWTLKALWPPTLGLLAFLLALFWCIDRHYYRKEGQDGVLPADPTPDTRGVRIEGGRNLALLAGIVALVLMSGLWRQAPVWQVLGVPLPLPSLVRDLGLLALIALSLRITPASVRRDNRFSWAPMAEVAKLFAGIFLTIAPVIAMLKAGAHGPFAGVVQLTAQSDGQPHPGMYFWLTGLLSAFLDNAPTYLAFFNAAGGDATVLMGAQARTLAAISAGAVFMGALTYIGNAPNLMVKAIAQDSGIAMPGFFGYMKWSCAVLLPLFAFLGWIFYF